MLPAHEYEMNRLTLRLNPDLYVPSIRETQTGDPPPSMTVKQPVCFNWPAFSSARSTIARASARDSYGSIDISGYLHSAYELRSMSHWKTFQVLRAGLPRTPLSTSV
jgi:hypothetical protein